ncbi:unnamed protein product [Phytophthora fragariaefolia]|uniref:Ubiquitin-like-conjugating enzyme ATG10 n=1 Tax=Phytophthora fragariaefolia TaxID=1490495 RepID=A0A9W6TQK5_9STRA|nr:unnamed protein product [Phytophthora fragariaefolia]
MELGWDIDELLQVEEANLTEDDEAQTALQPGNSKTVLVEFHIVYHTIYQTPVLYFRALAVDGTPLPASVVLRGVQFPGSNDRMIFAAMEEHPVLGRPYSFLHPCETAAAMQLLQTHARPKTLSEVEVPQKRRRSVSKDSDEAATTAKPSHRPLALKTALPLQRSHLPAPTKVSNMLGSSSVRTISPSNPAIRQKKWKSAESQELTADLGRWTCNADRVAVGRMFTLLYSKDATEPAFWIKRCEAVDSALKELDELEYVGIFCPSFKFLVLIVCAVQETDQGDRLAQW